MTTPDENELIPKMKCPYCGMEIFSDMQVCPYCGKSMLPDDYKRTGCLTAFLIFGFIGEIWDLIRYLIRFDTYLANYGEFLYILLISGVLNIILYIGMWKWKKWAVVACFIVSVVWLFVSFAVGKHVPVMIISFIIVSGVIILLIRPNWKHFK